MRTLTGNQKAGGCDFLKTIEGKTVDQEPFTATFWNWGNRITVDVKYQAGIKETLVDYILGTRISACIARLIHDVRREYLHPYGDMDAMKTRLL